MIQALIVDDEPNNVETLGYMLKRHCPDVAVIGSALNIQEGYDLICSLHPDLIFLDVQMHESTGFDLLSKFDRCDFEIIFVTAFDQYAMQAIKFSAIDYLLKPLEVKELKNAVSKVHEKIELKKDNQLLTNLLGYMQNRENKQSHKLALTTVKETLFVSPDKIIRCESSNAYTLFHFADGQKMTVSRPIYEYEELLADYGFIRCHQSHLVNKSYIKSLRKEGGNYLLLEDGSSIPVSRGKKEFVLKAIVN